MSEKDKKTLLQEIPLGEFFMGKVQEALVHRQVVASPMTEFYLVNLLQEFKKSEKLFESEGTKMMEKPLALLFANAVKGDTQTKIRCLKQMGDLSLYTAGFFAERVKKKLVDLDYYIRMGGGAYQSLSSILNREKTFAELYQELGTLFPDLVGVLSEVAATGFAANNRDLLKVYERWLATGSEHLEKMLKDEGIPTEDKTLLNKIQ